MIQELGGDAVDEALLTFQSMDHGETPRTWGQRGKNATRRDLWAEQCNTSTSMCYHESDSWKACNVWHRRCPHQVISRWCLVWKICTTGSETKPRSTRFFEMWMHPTPPTPYSLKMATAKIKRIQACQGLGSPIFFTHKKRVPCHLDTTPGPPPFQSMPWSYPTTWTALGSLKVDPCHWHGHWYPPSSRVAVECLYVHQCNRLRWGGDGEEETGSWISDSPRLV